MSAGHDDGGHGHGGDRVAIAVAALSLVVLAAAWIAGRLELMGPGALRAIAIAAYALPALFTVREVVGSIRHRQLDIDMLMLVAAIGAAALDEWAEGALLLALFMLGHALESYALGRARRAIAALAAIVPVTVRVRRADREEEIAVEALEPGDIALVRPDERIAADGIVVKGSSAVNEAALTGESVPAEKRAGGDRSGNVPREHLVFAGTINGPGLLEVRVTKRAGETMLARVVKAVESAEAEQAPAESFTKRFVKIFVPAILGLTALLLLAGLVVDEPFARTFYRAMAVLVAASPCALAISVPSAVLSGVARAGRSGVLIKGGGPLELLGRVDVIAFDKTGTLTEGKPRLTDVVPASGVTEAELLTVAVAVERSSEHPLARAVVRDADPRLAGQPVLAASDVESITARGVRALVAGERVLLGKPKLFAETEGSALTGEVASAVARLEEQGRSIVVVQRAGRFLGVLGLMDTPRPAAPEALKTLAGLGVSKMVMLSGDHQRAADAVARSVGLAEAWGALTPDDKLDAIVRLREGERTVAMVGDGVNDAPAMARASLGIAMGAAGSDVALETADVALMGDDLAKLPFVIELGRRASRVIRQNLWISLGAVAVLLPATVAGLRIGPAVAIHEGSTLVVVINGLRLLRYREGASEARR